MQTDAQKFLGSGLNFPVRTDVRGQLMLVSGNEDIEQSIRIILSTRPGERVMRPTFGCRAHELLFEPKSAATASLLREYVYAALVMWEPRIEVKSVDVDDNASQNTLMVEIQYEIKAIHDTRSIVHPFYLADEQEVD